MVLIPSGSRVKNPPHPRWSSHMLFSEGITLWHCLHVFCGVGIILFLYIHLCSRCQRSQTGVPYILFILGSIIFSKRKEYWVCETELHEKDLHNNLDFQLLKPKVSEDWLHWTSVGKGNTEGMNAGTSLLRVHTGSMLSSLPLSSLVCVTHLNHQLCSYLIRGLFLLFLTGS